MEARKKTAELLGTPRAAAGVAGGSRGSAGALNSSWRQRRNANCEGGQCVDGLREYVQRQLWSHESGDVRSMLCD
jgi:hypothetical protein